MVTELGVDKTVYRIGTTGPCVVVCHELPGITPAVADFCRHVAAQGFRVSCPVLLGVPGAPMNGKNIVQALLKVCISKEFSLFTAGKSSPIVDWLRAFGKTEHARCGGPGIGVVGMCFSGGFALALATDPHVLAGLPSNPMFRGTNPVTIPTTTIQDFDDDCHQFCLGNVDTPHRFIQCHFNGRHRRQTYAYDRTCVRLQCQGQTLGS